jgi:hypothetical protein
VLIAERDRRYRAEGGDAAGALAEAWARTDAIRAEVDDCFPLDEAATARLREHLAEQVEAIRAAEADALDALESAVG